MSLPQEKASILALIVEEKEVNRVMLAKREKRHKLLHLMSWERKKKESRRP